MTKRSFTLYLILLALIMTACSQTVSDYSTREANIAATYLQKQGYEILEHKNGRSYVLLPRMLLSHPHLLVWSVQSADVNAFLNKKISYETFEVKNHILDDWTMTMGDQVIQGKGKTTILVIVVDNKVIGGTALPVTDVPLGGLIFSLDGKTLEDIHSKSYAEWLDEWQNRFR